MGILSVLLKISIRRCASFLVMACFCFFACAAYAEDSSPNLVRVPVFFITDRNLESQSDAGPVFGPHRKYSGECLHDPYMGSGYLVVRNHLSKPITNDFLSLGWSPAEPAEKEGSYKIDVKKGKDFSAIKDDFFTCLADAALSARSRDLIIFAHGYKNSFEAALHTAGRFSYQYECPVILYSWPSVAKLRSYTSDENNNEWSQEHFNDALLGLEDLCRKHPAVHLRVFAHSMGSRLVVRATPFLREKHHVLEACLVCPDIDQGLVEHYVRRYLNVNGTAKLRVYMSQRDKALVFSQLVHGGYCRLGECADAIASLVSNMVPAAMASPGLPGSDEEQQLREKIEKTKKRMQTIDFTDLDSGMIGHKIPVELMYNMSYTEAPGAGLELVSESSGRRSKSSRLLSRLSRVGAKSAGLMPADRCLRVVKVAGERKVADSAAAK